LCGASVDAFLAIQERNPSAAERETALKSTYVRDVLTELGGKDRQVRHARGADVLVSQVRRF
jgi:hypothetical protein